MKKTLFFYFLCFLSSVAIGQRFQAGLIGGISTSQVDGDTYAGYDKAGLFAGGFVAKNFSNTNKWSVSFELTYIQKGSRKTPHPDKGDFASYALKLNYAEVPLLLRYNFGATLDSLGEQESKFAFEGGLAVGALVQSKEYDASGLTPWVGVPFQKTDYSIIFGLNYFISKHLVFDARTEYSIIPVRKGGTATYYQNWTYKFLKPGFYNNLIVFSLRYHL